MININNKIRIETTIDYSSIVHELYYTTDKRRWINPYDADDHQNNLDIKSYFEEQRKLDKQNGIVRHECGEISEELKLYGCNKCHVIYWFKEGLK